MLYNQLQMLQKRTKVGLLQLKDSKHTNCLPYVWELGSMFPSDMHPLNKTLLHSIGMFIGYTILGFGVGTIMCLGGDKALQ